MDQYNFLEFRRILLNKLLNCKNVRNHSSIRTQEGTLSNDLNLLRSFLDRSINFTLKQNLLILNLFEANETTYCDQFEFKFFKLAKLLLFLIVNNSFDNQLKTKKFKLNLIMLYTFNKSLKQYNLFKLNYSMKLTDEDSLNDEINLIELYAFFYFIFILKMIKLYF